MINTPTHTVDLPSAGHAAIVAAIVAEEGDARVTFDLTEEGDARVSLYDGAYQVLASHGGEEYVEDGAIRDGVMWIGGHGYQTLVNE